MSEEKRRILRHTFSVDKMFDLSREDARRYFMVEFFPPFAYNAWETHNSRYAILNICRSLSSKRFFPLVSLVNIGGNGSFMPAPIDAILTTEAWDQHGMYERTFGEKPNADKLSAALEKCFSDCFANKSPVRISECPLVASIIENFSESYKLNILTRCKDTVKRDGILTSQIASRDDALKFSHTYGRFYNSLNGEWEGLCPAGDLCDKCDILRKSKVGNNFYDDAGAN